MAIFDDLKSGKLAAQNFNIREAAENAPVDYISNSKEATVVCGDPIKKSSTKRATAREFQSKWKRKMRLKKQSTTVTRRCQLEFSAWPANGRRHSRCFPSLLFPWFGNSIGRVQSGIIQNVGRRNIRKEAEHARSLSLNILNHKKLLQLLPCPKENIDRRLEGISGIKTLLGFLLWLRNNRNILK